MKYVVGILVIVAMIFLYGLLSALLFDGPNYILLAVFGAIGGILFRVIITNWGKKRK
jgi:hypothetical protein